MCVTIVGLMQETDLAETTNPLLQAVESLPDGTVLIKGNKTLINLNLAGKIKIFSLLKSAVDYTGVWQPRPVVSDWH